MEVRRPISGPIGPAGRFHVTPKLGTNTDEDIVFMRMFFFNEFQTKQKI